MTQEILTVNWGAAELPPEEAAVRIQEEIKNLQLKIEELEAKKKEALEAAAAKGIKFYAGYRFVTKAPPAILDEGALADQFGDVFDAYLDWWPTTHTPKLTKTDLVKFLKKKYPNQADAILAAISREDETAATVYTLVKQKEASE